MNIKVDVTITDQGGSSVVAPKKTVSIVTGDGFSSRIRTTASYASLGEVPLNVDAQPEILNDGKIRLNVNLQYSRPGDVVPASPGSSSGSLRATVIQENLFVIVESGKSIIAAQSADPVGDRQVVIELKATILK